MSRPRVDSSPPPSWYEPPDEDWGVCPQCGCSQEDASCCGEEYVCPECGRRYSDDEAHPDPRDDEPADFDERRDR